MIFKLDNYTINAAHQYVPRFGFDSQHIKNKTKTREFCLCKELWVRHQRGKGRRKTNKKNPTSNSLNLVSRSWLSIINTITFRILHVTFHKCLWPCKVQLEIPNTAQYQYCTNTTVSVLYYHFFQNSTQTLQTVLKKLPTF